MGKGVGDFSTKNRLLPKGTLYKQFNYCSAEARGEAIHPSTHPPLYPIPCSNLNLKASNKPTGHSQRLLQEFAIVSIRQVVGTKSS